MLSQRRIEANRRNAARSTGPTSEEGKERSRANALKHGAAGEGVVLRDEDAAKRDARLISWRSGYVITNEDDEFVFVQMVTASVQVEACQERMQAIREHAAARAMGCWNDDRKGEVETLAAGLSRRPGRVAAELACSRHGVEWLIDQWLGLGVALDENGEWTDAQKARVFDLQGVDPDLRFGDPWAPGQTAAELVESEVFHLERKLTEALEPVDEHRRELVLRGRDPEPNRELIRLERYEAACLRKYQWARSQLKRQAAPAPAVAPPPPAAPPTPPRPAPVAAAVSTPMLVAPRPTTPAVAAPVPTPALDSPSPAPRRMTDRELREAARRAAKQGKR